MQEYLFSVEITCLPSYLPNRGEHHKSWVLPIYLQSTLFKDIYSHLDKSVWHLSKYPIEMKWFRCNIIFYLQGEFIWANDASVILFGLAVHISQTPAEQHNLPQVLFRLVLLYPLPLLLCSLFRCPCSPTTSCCTCPSSWKSLHFL